MSDHHHCQLSKKSNLSVYEDQPHFCCSKFLNFCQKWKTISSSHPKCREYLISVAVTNKEKKRHSTHKHWWIIHPFSKIRLYWEIVMTMVFFVAFITIPFMMCFVVLDYHGKNFDDIDTVIYIFCWIDIFTNLITGYYDEIRSEFILDQGKILQKYIESYFLIDVLSSLPWDRMTSTWRGPPDEDSVFIAEAVNLLPLLKLFRYFTFTSYIRQTQSYIRGEELPCQLTLTLLLYTYVVHWFTCFCSVAPLMLMHLEHEPVTKQLPAYMKKRLLAYYHHRFRNSYFREKKILSNLSDTLRQEVILHSCRRLVENVEIFQDLPKNILALIVSNLKAELYLAKDMIIKAGTQGECMFFLSSGTVAILTPTGKEVCYLEDGAHFGEVALLVQDQRRVASVVAVEVCEVYRLDRKDFRKCIAVHSDLFAKIERLATARMQRTVMIEEQHKRFTMHSRASSVSARKSRSKSTIG
ncbi:hypothetical protein QAD02_005095 [Eretmocerus hayati]|uniref:Uncharacterized protein n=1 Tax=Eretmocerus hayati TaxID=131215 RepID=A0ACC2NSN3_9HYME|nr:hypothetical protein QAD02_005095 [Eretmocerus hayati]